MVTVPQNWFVLALIICVICNVMFVLWLVTTHNPTKKKKQTFTLAHAPDTPYNHDVHVVVYLYRSNPIFTAQMLYRCFRSAFFPSHVHVHVQQELTQKDGYLNDVYDELKKIKFMEPYMHHVHIMNENHTESSGPLIGVLSILENSVSLRAERPNDVVVILPPFYHVKNGLVSKKSGLYSSHFTRGWDDALSWAFFSNPDAVFSGKLPQSSMDGSTSLKDYIQETSHDLNEGVPQSVVQSMMKHQSNFTIACNYFKNPAINQNSCFNTAKTETPVSKVRYTKTTFALPQIMVHNDFIASSYASMQKIMRCARRQCSKQARPVPFYGFTVLFSDIILNAGLMVYTMNHIPVSVIIDHRLSSQYIMESASKGILTRIKNFRPINWKLLHKQVEDSDDVVVFESTSRSQLIPLTKKFQQVGGMSAENLSLDAFLGISSMDTNRTIVSKYGSWEKYDQLKRVMQVNRTS